MAEQLSALETEFIFPVVKKTRAQIRKDDSLKNLFGNMTPSEMADYSNSHPNDANLIEYIARFADFDFKEQLFQLIPYK